MTDADPDYTISDGLLRQCLIFFRRHYAIVGFDDLLAAQRGQERLPPRSLLITFDDGWDDNLQFAAPRLADSALPALLFASTDAVVDAQNCWWQEVLLAALRQGRASYETLWNAIPGDPVPPADSERMLRLIVRYGACEAEIRQNLMEPYLIRPDDRHMLTPDRLRSLAEAGISVGSHGAAHLPLTMIADPGADIDRSRQALANLLPDKARAALSFPHGRYSPSVIAAALSAGFRFLFTSDAVLNGLDDGRPRCLLGRIEIAAHQIADCQGRLQSHRLATWLFLRPRRRLGADSDRTVPQ
jgi:peptidoglycan/xylan/chitin deacetylase (PgdA/CDA1 family)